MMKKMFEDAVENYQYLGVNGVEPLKLKMVEGEGFEPSKAEPSDLQSDPFDRSGTPPYFKRPLYYKNGAGDRN